MSFVAPKGLFEVRFRVMKSIFASLLYEIAQEMDSIQHIVLWGNYIFITRFCWLRIPKASAMLFI
jgi:hypothetical protein